MNDKKGLFGYLAAGLLGAAAGAAAMLGLSKQLPKMMEKCCGEMKDKCCCGPEENKTAAKKRKK